MSRYKKTAPVLTGLLFLFCLFGCDKEGLVKPISTQRLESNKMEIKLLRTKNTIKAEIIKTKKLITVKEGGSLIINNNEIGIQDLTFKPEDVDEDVVISFSWNAQKFQADFFPHGLVFNHPVQVRFSYKEADLAKINEESLGLYYYNEETGMWEYIGGEVDNQRKIITGYISHFSRYAIGAE